MSLKHKTMKIEGHLHPLLKRDEKELTDAEIITYLLIEEDNNNPYL